MFAIDRGQRFARLVPEKLHAVRKSQGCDPLSQLVFIHRFDGTTDQRKGERALRLLPDQQVERFNRRINTFARDDLTDVQQPGRFV